MRVMASDQVLLAPASGKWAWEGAELESGAGGSVSVIRLLLSARAAGQAEVVRSFAWQTEPFVRC